MVRVYLTGASATAAAQAGPAAAASGQLAPAVELEFRPGEVDASFLDLDQNRVIPVSPEVAASTDRNAWMAWSRANGVDLRLRVLQGKCTFGYIETCLVLFQADRFDGLTAEEIRARQELQGTAQTGNVILGEAEFPATYLFKTREGSLGALQMVGFTADGQGVRVRYRVLK